MCSSGTALLKAGKSVSTDLSSPSGTFPLLQPVEDFISQAESQVNVLTGVNYSDTYPGLNDDTKLILEDAVSSYAAMSMISYDMDAWTSRAKAQTALDVNWNRFTEAIKLLKEKKGTDFINKK